MLQIQSASSRPPAISAGAAFSRRKPDSESRSGRWYILSSTRGPSERSRPELSDSTLQKSSAWSSAPIDAAGRFAILKKWSSYEGLRAKRSVEATVTRPWPRAKETRLEPARSRTSAAGVSSFMAFWKYTVSLRSDSGSSRTKGLGVASPDRERFMPSWSSNGSATPSDSASTIKCPPLSTHFRISAIRGCGSCWR